MSKPRPFNRKALEAACRAYAAIEVSPSLGEQMNRIDQTWSRYTWELTVAILAYLKADEVPE